ncbi:MAG: SUMF1/EgtB/PvdO family nonheme iron enzyme [Polyangiaceae bacterium]|nr:SUMF1/EgtB/PvdO family nonheme iron enzyme [Polyangiaceae bacterium]
MMFESDLQTGASSRIDSNQLARRGRLLFFLGSLGCLTACERHEKTTPTSQVQGKLVAPDAGSAQAEASKTRPEVLGGMPKSERDWPIPKIGMVYIPPGALVVGTPPGQLPRRADRELAGEQVMLDGFYIDRFAYPNEEGAIPLTNMSSQEAERLCARSEKRLCTELEWERACKGPDNRRYEYGEGYDPEACPVEKATQLRPSGFDVACQSDFGVRGLHGGPFEWTSSDYRRGVSGSKKVIRGGGGPPGIVTGRCANLEGRDPESRDGVLGFRCCAGPKNPAEVELALELEPALLPRVRFEDEIEKALISSLPEKVRTRLRAAGPLKRQRVWIWRPIGNEELSLMALCGRGMPRPIGPRCGLLIARRVEGQVNALAWVSSGQWVANLQRLHGVESLWLIGGDREGSFKRPIRYVHGEVEVGEQSRGAPRPHGP